MANYGAMARRQRSAPALSATVTESQPLLLSISPSSSTTTVGELGEHHGANGSARATTGHSFFEGIFSHGRSLQNPEDRLFKDSDKDQETWANTQLGAPDMVASNLVITLSTA